MDQEGKSFEEITDQFNKWNKNKKNRIKDKIIYWLMYVITMGTLLLLLKNIAK